MIAVVVVAVVTAVIVCPSTVAAFSVPQPTDCSDHHNQIQRYCGVRFLCKCMKLPMPPQFFSDEDLDPNCKFKVAYRGKSKKQIKMDFTPFVFNLDDNLKDREDEEYEKDDDDIWIPITTEPEEEMPGRVGDGKPPMPEDTDTLGCGTEYIYKDEDEEYVLETVRSARIRNDKGQWRKVGMPGNVLPLLKSIHSRTDGRCEYVNALPYAGCLRRVGKREHSDADPDADDEDNGSVGSDDDDTKYVIRVRVAERRLRDTVINTVDQDFRTVYNATGDTPCFRSTKRDEILCHI